MQFVHLTLCSLILGFSLVLALDNTVFPEYRVDLRAHHDGQKAVTGNDPFIACDSNGYFTVLWNDINASAYRERIRGITFNPAGHPRAADTALYGDATRYCCSAENGRFLMIDYGVG